MPAKNVDSYSACSAARIIAGFSAVNPHAQFTLRRGGKKTLFSHSGEKWAKSNPKRPTSPHWYRTTDLQAFIGAEIHHARDRGAGKSIRQFVREFHGLTGSKSATAVVAAAGLSGKTLADMVAGDDVAPEKVGRLLAAMQAASREVKPKQLGVVGKAWFESRLVELYGVFAESIRYKAIRDVADGLPFVLEVALGVNAVRNENIVRDDDDGGDYYSIDEEANRKLVVALNWSPALQVPFVALDELLQEKRVDRWDGVTLLVHLAYPRLNFLDRGKSSLKLPRGIEMALGDCVRHVANEHHREKKRADRKDRLSAAAYERLRKARRPKKVDLIEAAYGVVEQAYRKVSGPHNAPAGARQIMYAVRPFVLERCGKCWKHSSYFTQTLLPDFMRDNPELTAEWDVVFDARGKLVEPHTGRVVNLGTIGVREYINGWRDTISANVAKIVSADGVKTCGPANRYRFALFIEKEGFGPHLEYARIAERFDVAIMSTKGMSVTACRHLVEELSDAGVTILVLRDFDAAGFSIVHTLRTDTRRFAKAQADAVRRAVRRAKAKANSATVIYVYEEIESGRKNDRPELARAVAHAKRSGATLVVAKLDRLARNVAFLSRMMESKVDFIAVDNPAANKLTLHILAAVAEAEAEAISARTKAALAAYKARGGKLGGALPQCNNLTQESRERGAKASAAANRVKTDEAYADLAPIVAELRQQGHTQMQIAERLNELGHTTRRGKPWGHVQVLRLLRRMAG